MALPLPMLMAFTAAALPILPQPPPPCRSRPRACLSRLFMSSSHSLRLLSPILPPIVLLPPLRRSISRPRLVITVLLVLSASGL